MPDGSVFAVTSAAADSAGEFVELELTLPAEQASPPPHVHRDSTEEYEVLAGRLDLMVGGTWRTLGPGELASIPPGTLHTFRNRSGQPVRARNVHRPPCGFEDFVEHMYRLGVARRARSAKDPRLPIYLAMLISEHSETLAPGRARERIALRLLTGLGRILRFDTRA